VTAEGGHSVAPLVRPGSLRVAFFKHPPRGHAASTGGKTKAGVGACTNPFPWGQCTYHAYEERPDVYDVSIANGAPRSGWDAWIWASRAATYGHFPEGTKPWPGALVVFPRAYGGSSVGHIAYVEKVNSNGTYNLSERNWNYNHNVTRRYNVNPYPGTVFIYGGPAGNGPGSQTSPQPPPVTSQPVNLLINPSFESLPGAPGWYRNNLRQYMNIAAYGIPSRAHDGVGFLEANTSVVAGSIAQDVAVAPSAGHTYTFSIWLRSPSGTSFPVCVAVWFLGTTNTNGSNCTNVGGAWQEVTAQAVAGAGYRSIRAEVYLKATVLNLDFDTASLVSS
jgi:surface antigen